ncbi:MAG: ABC transporter permease subunit, partial [Deltaproteobacteria bacterium]|nr:ABC transporter permease subunit [Deltaproteobacteria bacterium]
IQIVFILLMMWIYTALQRKQVVSLGPVARSGIQVPMRSLKDRFWVGGNVILILLLVGTPLFALVLRSFLSETGLTFAFYRALFENPVQSIFFVPPLEAVLYSCGFALVTLLFSVVIGLLAAQFLSMSKGRLSAMFDPIFMLPLSTSAVTLGFGFIIALDRPPLNLRTSLLLVPLAHTLVAFPFVVRSVLPALRSIPQSLKESASLLGASPFRVWRAVELPIIGRSLIVGAVFAFTISLGEFGATVFVARPQTPTMPLAIYRFLGQPGAMNYGQAMAMSSLLMLVTAAGFLMLEKLRVEGQGEF